MTLLSLPLLLSACAVVETVPDGRPLTGAEIELLFSGYSFNLTGMKSGNELLVYASEEYCTMRYVDGERTRTVRWYVQGDEHCCMKKGKPSCGKVYDMGGGVYYKFTDGRHSHTMQGFQRGNRL